MQNDKIINIRFKELLNVNLYRKFEVIEESTELSLAFNHLNNSELEYLYSFLTKHLLYNKFVYENAELYLNIAIKNDDYRICEFLLENININYDTHDIHIRCAILQDNLEIVKLLIKYKVSISDDCIKLSISKQKYDITYFLIKQGFNIKVKLYHEKDRIYLNNILRKIKLEKLCLKK